MNNKDILRALLVDLRQQIGAIDSNPMLPGAVKLACTTTFQILEILIAEASDHG